ncbi:hypothetical protein C8Q76DRAFT_857263 [Earliella scabrosa]|nr:hypothetical protein C8Q76DRAFT_857263 [Earliella scabrosa]
MTGVSRGSTPTGQEHPAQRDSISPETTALRRTNASLLVNSLPPELLAHIFATVATGSAWNNAHIVRATHVCWHWRTIAIQNPSLWTRLVIHRSVHTDAIAEFLRRSGTMPLSFTVRVENVAGSPGGMNCILQFVIPNIHRVRALHISIARGLGSTFYSCLASLHSPAPILEVFSVTIIGVLSVWPRTAGPTQALERPLFGGTAPSLRTLTIAEVRPTDLPVLSPDTFNANITTLKLVYNNNLPDLKRLHSLLAACPHLEVLDVTGNYPAPPPEDPTVHVLALPPSTRIVSLSSPTPHTIRALLSSLSLPPTCTIQVRISSAVRVNAYRAFPKHSPATPLLPLTCITRIEAIWDDFDNGCQTAPRGFTLRCYRAAAEPDPPALELFLSDHWSDFLSSCSKHGWPVDTTHVEDLILRGFPSEAEAAWTGLLLPFASLTRLRILDTTHTATQAVASTLRRKTPSGTFAAVPALRVVDICARSRDTSSGRPSSLDVDPELLFNALLDRARNGALREVSLENLRGWDDTLAARLMEDASGRLVVTTHN